MKKIYSAPAMLLERLNAEDVIATSALSFEREAVGGDRYGEFVRI